MTSKKTEKGETNKHRFAKMTLISNTWSTLEIVKLILKLHGVDLWNLQFRVRSCSRMHLIHFSIIHQLEWGNNHKCVKKIILNWVPLLEFPATLNRSEWRMSNTREMCLNYLANKMMTLYLRLGRPSVSSLMLRLYWILTIW